jgi:hypothetical protein
MCRFMFMCVRTVYRYSMYLVFVGRHALRYVDRILQATVIMV